jgi:hypothetical protein
VNTLTTRSLLIAALIAAAPLAADAAQAPAGAVAVVSATGTTIAGPIQLNNVTIQPSAGWQNNFAYPGLTEITFTNRNTLPATDILFTLHGVRGRIIGQIEDAGTYAPGQTVRHTFINNEIDPTQYLTVEEATFADGSVWTNPGPIAPISRPQAR